MANLAAPTRIGSGGSGYVISHNIYSFNTTGGSPLYLHFKTNVLTTAEKIFMIEAEGFNYGLGLPILCAWGIYTTGSGVSSKGLHTPSSTGLSADGIYKSSDNYACIRGYAGSHYYTGFVLHAYSSVPFAPAPITILAAAQSDNSGNYY